MPLRKGRTDLEIGVRAASAPEIRSRLLFRDTFIDVKRIGHSLFADRNISVARYAACHHIMAPRRGIFRGLVGEALEQLEYQCNVSVVVPELPDALEIVQQSDLIIQVSRLCLMALSKETVGTHRA
ncbi:LysR substrate-binding domain-containing protein [Gluconobacter wancherniae]|uniref:LysR substrate-binding domain-containing protein n=1 Tax=Gluconobacter wancherniae TaxID=1307955 RepID=UPI0030AEFE01